MKNPTVFAFLCETAGKNEVLKMAEEPFFLMEDVRTTKARIQANENGLNLSRVNIFAIISAESSFESVAASGKSLRASFLEDFSAADLTLLVLLSESNERADFSRRDAATYEFLTALSERETFFNRVFILSDKNEHGEILPNSKNLYAIAAALPLLNSIDTRFCEILDAKQRERGQKLFASAGFWQKPQPKPDTNSALRKLGSMLENEMRDIDETASHPLPDFFNPNIANDIASVAAKPLRAWHLWGRDVKEAEQLLFGAEAEAFFLRNYLAQEQIPNLEARKKKLRQAVSEEIQLRGAIFEAEKIILSLKQKDRKIKFGQSVEYVKIKIGEAYALRYQLQNLQALREKLSAEHTHLKSFLDCFGDVVTALKNLPLTKPDEAPRFTAEQLKARAETLAPIAVSLLRDDGLIRETHIIPAGNENRLLRLTGGFTVRDLTRLASARSMKNI